MIVDVDKLMRSILIQAEIAKDLDTFIKQLRIIAGEENTAIVSKMLKNQDDYITPPSWWSNNQPGRK